MNRFFIFWTRSTIILVLLFISVPGFGQNMDAQKQSKTQLYLVGVGTGDPDNINLRAVNAIDSDIIFCRANKFMILDSVYLPYTAKNLKRQKK